jgi:hypothetical protein
VRAAEVVAALSLATDLGIGLPLEHGLESTLVALRLGERLGIDPETASHVYYASLLFYVGCTADAEIVAEVFPDDAALITHFTPVMFGSRPEAGDQRLDVHALAARVRGHAHVPGRGLAGLGQGLAGEGRGGDRPGGDRLHDARGCGRSNTDPYATGKTADNEWVVSGPHLMVIVPDSDDLDKVPTDPENGGPWVMWKGTPYAHIMIPIGDQPIRK